MGSGFCRTSTSTRRELGIPDELLIRRGDWGAVRCAGQARQLKYCGDGTIAWLDIVAGMSRTETKWPRRTDGDCGLQADQGCPPYRGGGGAQRLVHRDIQATIIHWARAVRVDPDDHLLQRILERVARVNPNQVKAISLGLFIYAGLSPPKGSDRC